MLGSARAEALSYMAARLF